MDIAHHYLQKHAFYGPRQACARTPLMADNMNQQEQPVYTGCTVYLYRRYVPLMPNHVCPCAPGPTMLHSGLRDPVGPVHMQQHHTHLAGKRCTFPALLSALTWQAVSSCASRESSWQMA